MYQNSVPALMSKNLGNTLTNYKTWNSILYNAKDYGAKIDGATNDSAAIQAAVNAAGADGGGVVFVPAGNCVITSTIYITRSVRIVGAGIGSHSTNTNGNGLGVTRFIWNGASGGTMFYFKSDLANEYLFGGGMEGCMIDGSAIAGIGIRGSSIGYMEFRSIEGRSFITQMMRIDADNGVLTQFNVFENIHYVYGAGVATQGGVGIAFVGNASAGVTQNHIISVTGLVYNGSVLFFAWCDNNIVEKCHAVVLGAGYAVSLVNGVGGNAAKNVFKYVVGKIFCDSLTEGNVFQYIVSEGGGLVANTGAQVHYTVQDYTNDRLFRTHTYVMSDILDIPRGDMVIVDGSAVAGIAALQWPSLDLAKGTDGRIGLVSAPPYTWNKGTITSLRIWFTTDVVTANLKWRATIRLSSVGNLSSLVTPALTSSVDVPVNGQYTYQFVDVPIGLAYSNGDSVAVSIQRNGAHANDTALGKIQIMGASLWFVATGPDSAGSGTWPVTQPNL